MGGTRVPCESTVIRNMLFTKTSILKELENFKTNFKQSFAFMHPSLLYGLNLSRGFIMRDVKFDLNFGHISNFAKY